MDKASDLSIPDMPGISFSDGLARLGGNLKLYKKLLSQFYSSNTGTVDNINTAISNGNDKAAIILAHTLKGVAANLGANQLAAICTDLETALKQGRIAKIEGLLAKFSTEFTIVMVGISTFEKALALPETKAHDKVNMTVDRALLRPLFVNMAKMLENGMVEAMEHISILEDHLSDAGVQKQFQELKQDLDMFDMDSALINLKSIAMALEISLYED
ncbi:hypothetical protein SBF1_5850001 [Candidatus Desulfosporosinus infrequens]|uniref:HPt domain-containing protein n=1 Tax=Candidatus Desulfosporosinus infrequens TaxID=2043169 RepID=A0A2U3LKP6_9FIRM|nr:hypothetical protein SBF1_5850001 [Candidatus Desulfosporosinus infrequens]